MTGRVTSASFVGRQEELTRLHRALQSAAAGEPTTVLIAGEAGIGKTRLVEEFAAQVDGQAGVLLGRCVQLSGGGLPYGAIVDALRGLTRSPWPSRPGGTHRSCVQRPQTTATGGRVDAVNRAGQRVCSVAAVRVDPAVA
jgi:hypothetical protein